MNNLWSNFYNIFVKETLDTNVPNEASSVVAKERISGGVWQALAGKKLVEGSSII